MRTIVLPRCYPEIGGANNFKKVNGINYVLITKL